ncbi:TPA: hypothetical protein WHO95_001982, partial [Neisseria meningitidis]
LRRLVLIFVNPLYNVGIGSGALLGHWVTQYVGISRIGIAGMLAAAAGLWLCLNLNRHIRT